MKKINLLILVLAVLFSTGCKKDEVIIPPDPIKDEYSKATFSLNFDQIDPKIKPIFEAYLQTYDAAIIQGNWSYQDIYSLKDFNTVIFGYDSDNNKFEAAYMIVPPNGAYSGSQSNVLETTNQPSDGTKIIRVTNQAFLKKLIEARLSEGEFGSSTVDNGKYLYFFFDKSNYESSPLTPLSIFRSVGLFIHEGFHVLPQVNFTSPNDEYRSIRFNLPSDYPADSVSFSLIAAGIKIYENILFENNQDMIANLKMYDVLFRKLRQLDMTGKNYIDGFYLYECWLEGGAEFPEYKMLQAGGLLDGNVPEIYYDNSFQEFKDKLVAEINSGEPATVSYNGQDVVLYYSLVVETTYYKLGSATLYILDELGVNVMEEVSMGKNPFQMLEDYIADHNITINEEQEFENIKSQINWEEMTSLMQDYIQLYN